MVTLIPSLNIGGSGKKGKNGGTLKKNMSSQ